MPMLKKYYCNCKVHVILIISLQLDMYFCFLFLIYFPFLWQTAITTTIYIVLPLVWSNALRGLYH